VEARTVAAVLGDPDRLQQVVWNLLSNAIKFTPVGGTVRAIVEKHGGQVELIVRDTGEGIEPDFLPHVFERFEQAKDGRHREGLGLGLAIAKELVELHGGTIKVHSEGKGKGAEFRALFPIHRPAAAVAPSEAQAPARGESSATLAGKRVLVIDDEPEARQILHTVLRRYGANVVTAASAAKAVQILSDYRPDVVTCDLEMPEIDGYQLVRLLREQYAEPPLPIVALTASASDADRHRALECGFHGHLGKPVEPQQLVATLAELAHSH
jgi:CheY-like chemotaxis protein/anti-sigma regulatory factor (Ser/Thr protein kinase)